MTYDVIIIGGGAGGLLCAIEAGRRGRSVAVIEKNAQIGRKILAAGGGRCNFTNLHMSADHYISANVHFVKSAIARFAPKDLIAILEKGGVTYCEESDGKLFCKRTSRDLLAMLAGECEAAGVKIIKSRQVSEFSKGENFIAKAGGVSFEGKKVVIATGGLSYPKLGSTDIGHRIARQFGIAVTDTKPGLVPFRLKDADLPGFSRLAGISFDAKVACRGKSYRGGILITHEGISGPPVLQISSRWSEGESIEIDLIPDVDIIKPLAEKKAAGSKMTLKKFLSAYMPERLAEAWCLANAPSCQMSFYADYDLEVISKRLHEWEITPAGTEGYAKAEITVGGVDTREMSSKSMESERVPGLYFIGEVLDVAGELGGYNLHWAFASGFAAGQYV